MFKKALPLSLTVCLTDDVALLLFVFLGNHFLISYLPTFSMASSSSNDVELASEPDQTASMQPIEIAAD